jgi:hypothetical protein
MLKQVLHEIESAQGPVSLDALGRKLNIDRSVLDGMIQFWVRKGRLQIEGQSHAETAAVCGGSCRTNCAGPQSCPFVVHLPLTYSLNPTPDPSKE